MTTATLSGDRFKITAWCVNLKRRVHVFTWAGSAEAGVRVAENDCKRLGLEAHFHDFKAEEIAA